MVKVDRTSGKCSQLWTSIDSKSVADLVLAYCSSFYLSPVEADGGGRGLSDRKINGRREEGNCMECDDA